MAIMQHQLNSGVFTDPQTLVFVFEGQSLAGAKDNQHLSPPVQGVHAVVFVDKV